MGFSTAKMGLGVAFDAACETFNGFASKGARDFYRIFRYRRPALFNWSLESVFEEPPEKSARVCVCACDAYPLAGPWEIVSAV